MHGARGVRRLRRQNETVQPFISIYAHFAKLVRLKKAAELEMLAGRGSHRPDRKANFIAELERAQTFHSHMQCVGSSHALDVPEGNARRAANCIDQERFATCFSALPLRPPVALLPAGREWVG